MPICRTSRREATVRSFLLLSAPALLLITLSLLAGCRRAEVAPPPAPGTSTPVEAAAVDAAAAPSVRAASSVDAGRYLVVVGGCNDCHTSGYLESGGALPEEEWLTGSIVGFRGPWGTSYPSNLRLTVQDYDEDTFVEMVHTRQDLPPMPWPNINRMSEQDARAIHRYLVSLGPRGERMPAPVAPNQEPTTPYFDFVPQHLERLQVATTPAGDAL